MNDTKNNNIKMKSNALDKAMNWSIKGLIATVWGSTILFGVYILIFYFLALIQGNMEQWNGVLKGLYDPNTRAATLGVGIHFAGGGIILILGCIQLLDWLRIQYPALHRWLGRVYILSAFGAAIGGLVFIFTKGTIGGLIMDIGFAGYGILTFLAAFLTLKFARARNIKRHRAWGIRLFALAIGSWLYRMDYGFWILFMDGVGHTPNFNGSFDYFMVFFFYLPNLLVAEVFIGEREIMKSKWAKAFAIISVSLATAFLLLATYSFTNELWLPKIIDSLYGTH